jgi:hypothetical protein
MRASNSRRSHVDHGLGHQARTHRRDDVLGLGGHVVAIVAADQVHARLEAGGDALGGGLAIMQRSAR